MCLQSPGPPQHRPHPAHTTGRKVLIPPPTPHPPSPFLIYPLPQAPSSVDKRIKPLKVASSASQPGEEVPPSRSSQPEPARQARPPTSPLPRSPHTDAYPCGSHRRHRNVPKRAPHRSQHRHHHLGRHVASPPLPAPPYSNPDSVGSVFRHPRPSTSRPAPGLENLGVVPKVACFMSVFTVLFA